MPGRARGRTSSEDLQRYPGVRGFGISHLVRLRVVVPLVLLVVLLGRPRLGVAVGQRGGVRLRREPVEDLDLRPDQPEAGDAGLEAPVGSEDLAVPVRLRDDLV